MKAARSANPSALVLGLVIASLMLASTPVTRASLSYTTAGSTYSQNFDSLPNTPSNASLGNSPTGWTDDNASPGLGNFSIVGWYLYHPTSQTEGGFNGHQRVRVTTGNTTTGAFYSFGSAAAPTDRALGDIGSATLAPDGGNIYIALRISNNTGQTLDSFTVGYTGEQWRDAGVSTAETMTFSWSTTATSVSDPPASFNNVAALSWTTPKATGTAAALDGNNAANQVVLSPITVTGLNWASGTDLWLRLTDVQLATLADAGMGIDDFTFSADIAVPEPSTCALLGLGALALFIRRRR